MNPEPLRPPPLPPPPGAASTRAASPLAQAAAHLRAWDWEVVVRQNRRACERECAQHGPNPETQAEVALAWDAARMVEQTLGAVLDFLRACQERAPFLFENAATFAALGRELMQPWVAGLGAAKSRAILLAVSDYISGGLARTELVEIVEGLWEAAPLRPGMRVKTLRGAVEGVVLQVLPDHRVLWRPRGSLADLVAEAGSLLPVRPPTSGPPADAP